MPNQKQFQQAIFEDGCRLFLKYFKGKSAKGEVCFECSRQNLKIRRGYFWEKRPPQYFFIFGIKNHVSRVFKLSVLIFLFNLKWRVKRYWLILRY
jgi:hypothetical protein